MHAAVRTLTAPLLKGIDCPPTDLHGIARGLSIPIIEESIGGSGELRRTTEGLQIICNPKQAAHRRRFTIAHELGHAIIEESGDSFNQNTIETERLCDLFAVELLMPEHRFREHLPQKVTFPGIRALAAQYQTSLQTTAYRCAELANVTIIEAKNGKFGKPYGQLQRANAADVLLDESLRALAMRACKGESGTTQLYLTHRYSVRQWNIHYHPLGSEHALFILTPIRMQSE
jgi:Zn-dependent peptidase ImmA (M78 family)